MVLKKLQSSSRSHMKPKLTNEHCVRRRASALLQMIRFLRSFFMSTHCGAHSTCISQLNNLVLSEVKKNHTRMESKALKKITLVLQFSMVSTERHRFEVGIVMFSPEKPLGMKSLLLRSRGQVDSRTDLASVVLCCDLLCFLSRRSLVFTSASLSSVLRKVQDKLFTPHFPECILRNLHFKTVSEIPP